MEKTTISNNEFITLFIRQLQSRYLLENKGCSLYSADLHFESEVLKEFIYHSKRDPKYSEFLSCFNFHTERDKTYCIELATAINYALSHRLIIARVGDLHYISKRYYLYSPKVDVEWIQIMDCFISDLSAYIYNPEEYLQELEYITTGRIDLSASDIFRFSLQRSLNNQKCIQYNTEDKS